MILPVPVAGAAPRPLLASLVVHGKGQEAWSFTAAVVSPRKGEKWDGLAEMCEWYGFIWIHMGIYGWIIDTKYIWNGS